MILTNIEIARSEAQRRGLTRYFTGKPCKRGHVSERFTNGCACIACHNERNAADYQRQKAAGVDVNKRARRYNRRNREKRRAQWREWKQKNVGYVRARDRARSKENRAYFNAWFSSRRAHRHKATPKWINHQEIIEFYRDCPPGHHVDHIIPLLNPTVCGLHVPWNLQYLTALENMKKGNRIEQS